MSLLCVGEDGTDESNDGLSHDAASCAGRVRAMRYTVQLHPRGVMP